MKERGAHRAGPRVLVVDDLAESAELLREVLEEEGIQVAGTAYGGRQAVLAAAKLHPNVVLMDLRMKGLDGIEATRAIKAERPWVQVIALTIYETATLTRAAADAGAYCYLVKGCPASLIVDMVRRASAHSAALAAIAARSA